MLNKYRNKILLLGLTGGYFVYRKALKHVIFQNQNVFLNQESVEDLKKNNYVNVGGNRMLIGSIMNQTYRPEKKRVIIIGGGLIGASAAYELSKNNNLEVFLIEKNDDVGQETSFMNGALICPSLTAPWVSRATIKKCLSSIFTSQGPIDFSFQFFGVKYVGTWLLNMFGNLTSSGYKSSMKKLLDLANNGVDELKVLDENYDFKQATFRSSQGNIKLFTSKDALERDEDSRNLKTELGGLKFEILNQQEAKNIEPNLSKASYSFEYSTLSKNDSNADSYQTTKYLSEIAEQKGAVIFKDVTFQRFLFERSNSKLIGIVTSQGTILCDKVIISGGYNSKSMMDLLGLRLPLVPIQGYTFTIPKPKDAQNFKYNIVDESNLVHITALGDKIRIAGMSDVGVNNQFNTSRLDLLVNESKKILGDFDESDGVHWHGVRPFTPDDVPIISRVPGHDEIYINTGHGSKGLTLCLGSAKILRGIIENSITEKTKKEYSIDRFYSI